MGVEIDWTTVSVATLSCQCGKKFRGKAKAIFEGPDRGIVSEKRCPGCKQTNRIWGIESDPEEMVL